MLNYYPANRLENLVVLVDAIISQPKKHLLSADIVLTQNKGMQHWLNMEIAKVRGIAMNIDYQMPAQFIWQIFGKIFDKEQMPLHNDCQREVLSWRIYQLLASPIFCSNPLSKEPTQYWRNQSTSDNLKRWQLAEQLADLFEQYLIFRPDWLANWQQGEFPEQLAWQGLLWQLLVEQQPITPLKLLQQANHLLKTQQYVLPERVFIFGINAMPPLWLDFISALGEHCDVHLLHLNPCVQYWGDIQPEKQLARWLASNEEHSAQEAHQDYNPLLANLGQQGKEFIHLLPPHCLGEISVYEQNIATEIQEGSNQSDEKQGTLLKQIQDDILKLEDARNCERPALIDDSIVITSAHSPLREVQGLHDYLLHQFNQNASLTPKDVLVMCPQIEDYAPYIESVFARSWDEFDESIPPLPCSIADRVIRNLEPVVETFMQLLALPDSRFCITELLDYLRLPAISEKFDINEEELERIEGWLLHAGVHWGLDSNHKADTLIQGETQANTEKSSVSKGLNSQPFNNKFTWQAGIDRLMLGFAWGDSEHIYQDKLLLPLVEGQDALLLGKLMALLEMLASHVKTLSTSRTPKEWHHYLNGLCDDFYAQRSNDEEGLLIISQAIEQLAHYSSQAHFNEVLELNLVKNWLNNHFNQSDPHRQFLTGQVTFCSMVPMRSIPFKVVCILGLNDGDFPRQRQPIGFDLIAKSPARPGDRSRRNDDRYLFLEALISVREALYLSYQGKSIKDNSDREPSIVLKELQDYLSQGYGWDFDSEDAIRNLPLQAFSKRNYISNQTVRDGDNTNTCQRWPAFSPQWLKLVYPQPAQETQISISPVSASDSNQEPYSLTVDTLVKLFDKPIQNFAARQLNLHEQDLLAKLEDDEPFNPTSLDKYNLQQAFVAQAIDELTATGSADLNSNGAAMLKQAALLSDKLPDIPVIDETLDNWQSHAIYFANEIVANAHVLPNTLKTSINAQYAVDNYVISQELSISDNEQVIYRLTSAKAKDYLNLWLKHLMAQLTQTMPITTKGYYYREKLKSPMQVIEFSPIAKKEAELLLTDIIACYQQAMTTPTFIPASLGHAVFTKTDRQKNPLPFCQAEFEKLWLDNGYEHAEVIRYLTPNIPDFEQEIKPWLVKLYYPLFCHLNPKLSTVYGDLNND